jgi:hypothetical protein
MMPSREKHTEKLVMTTMAQQDWQEQADDPEVCIDGRVDPQQEDSYWRKVFWAESYYRGDLGYDDYAPAYCVGYCGYAQYGGRFADAEKSLCANWLRIKGDSRLEIEEALQAIRAAWNRASGARREREQDEELDAPFTSAQPVREPALAVA